MINSYLTDEISIINQSVDEWSHTTEKEPLTVPARVGYKTRTITKPNKEEVEAVAQIALPPGTNIKNDSKVKVLKLRGVDAPEPDKKYTVVSMAIGHGFSQGQSWVKVWVS